MLASGLFLAAGGLIMAIGFVVLYQVARGFLSVKAAAIRWLMLLILWLALICATAALLAKQAG
jgi:hypothetical protein